MRRVAACKTMNKADRHRYIVELLESNGEVQVSEVSTRIGVSEMTVRRDLETLEQVGALSRVHGGAVHATISRSWEPGYHARGMQRLESKRRIGLAAAALLHEGETVVIDAGTTTVHVAEALRGRRGLRVLALSLRIADVLVDEPDMTVMVPGGIARAGERSLIGSMAERAFEDLYFDTFVLSAGGVDAKAGVTEYVPEDAAVKRAALLSARRRLLVADSSKLGEVAFARVAPISEIDTLITDGEERGDVVEALRSEGMRVITV